MAGLGGFHLYAKVNGVCPTWEQEVVTQAASIRSRVLIAGIEQPHQQQAVLDCVRQAEEVLRDGPSGFNLKRRVVDWWNGGRVEQSWSFLHEADLLLLETASESYIATRGLDDARARANSLDQFNPVRRRFMDASRSLTVETASTPGAGA
jgi:hypothetical protein